MTDTFVLDIGEAELDIDAGLVSLNQAPEPQPDMVLTCADDVAVVDVLSNDTDPDGDSLSITMIGGQAVDPTGGQVTLDNGTIVTLVVDPFSGSVSLAVDGEAAFADLDIDETATQAITYTVDDGNGNTATTTLDVTFKGDANSIESLEDSLPTDVITYQIADAFAAGSSAPFGDFGYDILISDAGGDERFEGVQFNQAYCLDFLDPAATGLTFDDAPLNTADLFLASEDRALDVFEDNQVGINGLSAEENFDLINWIIAQDFEDTGAGSVNGDFSGWEVQFAIWELTNNVDSDLTFDVAPEIGQIEDVDFIVQQALAFGEDFVAGVGDTVGVILDPNPSSSTNAQPFILAVDYEDIDCLCPADEDNGGLPF